MFFYGIEKCLSKRDSIGITLTDVVELFWGVFSCQVLPFGHLVTVLLWPHLHCKGFELTTFEAQKILLETLEILGVKRKK